MPSPLNDFSTFKCHKSYSQTLKLLPLLHSLHLSIFLLLSEIFNAVNMTGTTALAAGWQLVCAYGGQRTFSCLLKQLFAVLTAHLCSKHLPLRIFEFLKVVGNLNFKDLSVTINLTTGETVTNILNHFVVRTHDLKLQARLALHCTTQSSITNLFHQ